MKDCTQCGRCCTLYANGGLSASDSEIAWWETHRPEVFRFVVGQRIWISPVTGRQLVRCPWLRKLPLQDKYICRIYHDRPDDCRVYPVDIDQMVADGCEMLEPRDLVDQISAQRELDRLMSDTRPPGRK